MHILEVSPSLSLAVPSLVLYGAESSDWLAGDQHVARFYLAFAQAQENNSSWPTKQPQKGWPAERQLRELFISLKFVGA